MRDRLTMGRTLAVALALAAGATRAAAQVREPPVIIHRTPTEPEIGRRDGWYFGLAGGVTSPIGDTKDGYDMGWNFRVPVGWQRPGAALGLQLDLQYDRLPAKGDAARDLTLWSGMLDAVARFPVGPSGKSGLYVLAGPGLHYVRDVPRAGAAGLDYENIWRVGLNAGLGVGVGVGRRGELFAEGRYTHVWTPDEALRFLPVTGGVKFVF